MRHTRLMLLVLTLLASCAPAQSLPQSLSTSTVTATLTPIPSPTVTPTSTPIPTPIGGSGRLMIVANDAIKIIHPDGSDEEIVLTQQQFEEKFPRTERQSYRLTRLSPDGKKILVLTCEDIRCYASRLYLALVDSTDPARRAEYSSFRGGLLEWSPASDGFLMQESFNDFGKQVVSATDINFGQITELPPASAAFWSFDGKQIYYYDRGWYTVNNDGSGKQALKCDMCAMASEPSAYALAQSPDGQKIAIGTIDGTVIITDPDLANFKLAALGSYVGRVRWSPDSMKLVVDITTSSDQSDIVILGADGTIIRQLPKPEGVKYVNTCGWSPDSREVDYLAILDAGYDLYVQAIGGQGPIHLLSLNSEEDNCPVWLLTP